jgi:hypothetical protein
VIFNEGDFVFLRGNDYPVHKVNSWKDEQGRDCVTLAICDWRSSGYLWFEGTIGTQGLEHAGRWFRNKGSRTEIQKAHEGESGVDLTPSKFTIPGMSPAVFSRRGA